MKARLWQLRLRNKGLLQYGRHHQQNQIHADGIEPQGNREYKL